MKTNTNENIKNTEETVKNNLIDKIKNNLPECNIEFLVYLDNFIQKGKSVW